MNQKLIDIDKYNQIIKDLTFIATFEPNKKPSFRLGWNDCSSVFGSLAKYYMCDTKISTYNRIHYLITDVRIYGDLLWESKYADDRALLSKLIENCFNAVRGLENLYITYPYPGFEKLTTEMRFLGKYYLDKVKYNHKEMK